MKISAYWAGILCVSMIAAGLVLTNEVKAHTVITVGTTGDFQTIEAATDSVRTRSDDTFYTISVQQDYTGLESFPITINMQAPNPVKSVEIVGYPTSITLNAGNAQTIFDVKFNFGSAYEFIITNFDLEVQSASYNVIYIHDSYNVIITQNQLGGSSNYHCKNGIYAVNSYSLGFSDLTINYCHEDGIRMNNVNNLNNLNIYRGIDYCDITLNDDDGVDLTGCSYIRCIDTYLRYNSDNGMEVKSSDYGLINSSPTYTINDNGQNGILLDGNCDLNYINYTIYDNDYDGILFDGVAPSSSSNINYVEDASIYGNDRDGIEILDSEYITVMGFYAEIYDNDIGISIIESHDVLVDFNKMEVTDPSSIYENNIGIFCDSSYAFDILQIVLTDNRMGLNNHFDRYEPDDFEANIAVLSCYDFFIGDFIFIIGHESGYHGIYLKYCYNSPDTYNEITLIRFENYDVDTYNGILLETTMNTYLQFIKDTDGLTKEPIKVDDCYNIIIEEIDFERETSCNNIGVFILNSYDVLLQTTRYWKSCGYGEIGNYGIGIKIEGSYNVEVNNIDIYDAGIGISICNDLCEYYNIDIIKVKINFSDNGMLICEMFDSSANIGVEIIDSAIYATDSCGIDMRGSEVILENTLIWGYASGSIGVYNKYGSFEDQYYPGFLKVESDCNIYDSYGNWDIKTEGYDLDCKSVSDDYKHVSQHLEIGNIPLEDYYISIYTAI